MQMQCIRTTILASELAPSMLRVFALMSTPRSRGIEDPVDQVNRQVDRLGDGVGIGKLPVVRR